MLVANFLHHVGAIIALSYHVTEHDPRSGALYRAPQHRRFQFTQARLNTIFFTYLWVCHGFALLNDVARTGRTLPDRDARPTRGRPQAGRGGAAAATWRFRDGGAAAAAWIFRGERRRQPSSVPWREKSSADGSRRRRGLRR